MPDVEAEQWKEIVALKPIAVVHHGENTDRAFLAGQPEKIRDFVKKAHDYGVLAGISPRTRRRTSRAWRIRVGSRTST